MLGQEMKKAPVCALLLCLVGAAVCQLPFSKTCLGCPRKVNPNAFDVQYLLKQTVAKQNEQNYDEPITIVNVTEAYRQVVAGLKYEMNFEAEGQNTKTKYNCHTILVLAPWVNREPQVLEYKCLFGGY